MCEWGTDVEVENLLAYNHEGLSYKRRTWKIDACIAPLVVALNTGGIDTIASCCGHGKGPGLVSLADDRELLLFADMSEVNAYRASQPVGSVGETP